MSVLGNAVPAAASAVLLAASALISMRRFFWNDELYSYYLLADPSFTGMLAAFHDTINNSPPLYFLLGWIWSRIFGADELSLRLFSSVGVCTALWLMWLTLRRAYGLWPANVGVLGVFCTSGLILSQNAEARMYGLFLALSAAAVLLHDRVAREDVVSARTALLLFSVHAGIVLTHLLGPLFSAGFLLALILSDRAAGRFRPRAWLPILAAWLAFLLYLPSFLVQVQAGRPRSWLPSPTLGDLVAFMAPSESGLLAPTAIVLVVFTVTAHFLLYGVSRAPGTSAPTSADAATGSRAVRERDAHGGNRHLVLLAVVLIGAPLVAWSISVAVRPIFQDRYLVPAALGWAILLSHGVAATMAHASRFVLVPAAVTIVLLVQPLRHAVRQPVEMRPGIADDAIGYADLPVVVQSSHRFLERMHYAPRADRYFFVLDWETAVDDASGPFGPQEYRHLEALLRNYPERFAGRVVEGDEFLAAHERFLVIDAADFDRACPPHVKGLRRWDDIHCPQWLERRVLGTPRYTTTVLAGVGEETVLLVSRADASRR